MVETINKMARIQRQLTLELNREPTDEELAKKMGISPDKVREVMKISQDPVSLETPIGEEEDSHLGDFVPDERSLSPEEYATNEILKEEIKSVLSTLQPREQQVLELRFGLIDGTSYTLEEVGKRFNVTRERIRQIEAKALENLDIHLELRNLKTSWWINMKISKRLKSLAGLITLDDKVADIGCDHALLDIYMVKNNITEKVLIADVSENALENGIKNVKKYHLEDKITAKCGNGLDVINNDIDTVIISGMGASTIIKILSSSKLNQIKKLIIQSNNDHYLLRRFLTNKGFYIAHEAVIYDNGKYYINIMFQRGFKKYSKKELIYGPILIDSNKEYFNYLLKKQTGILENVPKYRIFTE